MDQTSQNNNTPAHSTWWGAYTFELGQTSYWRIGPLKLAIRRQEYEWDYAAEPGKFDDIDLGTWRYTPVAADVETFSKYNAKARVVTGEMTGNTLWLKPALADRPVIAQPHRALNLPVRTTVTIIVSSPLWIQLRIDQPAKYMVEIPLQRPSDTWFGPSPMEGHLSYNSPTAAHTNFERMPRHIHRAYSQVLIRNHTKTWLCIERLSLPTPQLSLFETLDGYLWTEVVTVTHKRENRLADVQIGSQPPPRFESVKRVSEPRDNNINIVARAFRTAYQKLQNYKSK